MEVIGGERGEVVLIDNLDGTKKSGRVSEARKGYNERRETEA